MSAVGVRSAGILSADEHAVMRYTPKLPLEVWAAVGDFVRAAVSDCVGRVLCPTDRMMRVSCRLVVWAWVDGLPLERDVVFSRHLVGLFVDRGCDGLARRTRSAYRSLLLGMGRVLAPAQHPARLPLLGPGPVPAPYTLAEQAALRSWARSGRTAYRREHSAILLALGFGAGLARVDMADLRVRHVAVDRDGLVVEVAGGKRPRTVPVRREWEAALAEAACSDRSPGEHLLLPRARRHREHIVRDPGKSYSVGAPNGSRMRSTWITTQLAAGVPAKALLAAAGVESLESFDRYIRFVQDADPVSSRQLLRGKRA